MVNFGSFNQNSFSIVYEDFKIQKTNRSTPVKKKCKDLKLDTSSNKKA